MGIFDVIDTSANSPSSSFISLHHFCFLIFFLFLQIERNSCFHLLYMHNLTNWDLYVCVYEYRSVCLYVYICVCDSLSLYVCVPGCLFSCTIFSFYSTRVATYSNWLSLTTEYGVDCTFFLLDTIQLMFLFMFFLKVVWCFFFFRANKICPSQEFYWIRTICSIGQGVIWCISVTGHSLLRFHPYFYLF